MTNRLIMLTVLICSCMSAAAGNALDKMFDEAKKLKDVDITYVERHDPATNRLAKRSLVVGWNKSSLLKKILKAVEQDRDIATKYVINGNSRGLVEIMITITNDNQESSYSIAYKKSDMSWRMTATCKYINKPKGRGSRADATWHEDNDDDFVSEELASAYPAAYTERTVTQTISGKPGSSRRITVVKNGNTTVYYESHSCNMTVN
ncbi:MAG: DUF5024 domain-containing protein [Muribaculaceae bacterium]|nr:DUF5024 domain-containing protein [Muribaculaceae bacterium]